MTQDRQNVSVWFRVAILAFLLLLVAGVVALSFSPVAAGLFPRPGEPESPPKDKVDGVPAPDNTITEAPGPDNTVREAPASLGGDDESGDGDR